jgi:hypothetical protein
MRLHFAVAVLGALLLSSAHAELPPAADTSGRMPAQASHLYALADDSSDDAAPSEDADDSDDDTSQQSSDSDDTPDDSSPDDSAPSTDEDDSDDDPSAQSSDTDDTADTTDAPDQADDASSPEPDSSNAAPGASVDSVGAPARSIPLRRYPTHAPESKLILSQNEQKLGFSTDPAAYFNLCIVVGTKWSNDNPYRSDEKLEDDSVGDWVSNMYKEEADHRSYSVTLRSGFAAVRQANHAVWTDVHTAREALKLCLDRTKHEHFYRLPRVLKYSPTPHREEDVWWPGPQRG